MKTGLMAEESFERLGFHEQAMVIVPDTSVDVHAQGKKGFVGQGWGSRSIGGTRAFLMTSSGACGPDLGQAVTRTGEGEGQVD